MTREQMMEKWAIRRAKVRECYAALMPLTQIAKRFRISPARVHQIVNSGKRKRKTA